MGFGILCRLIDEFIATKPQQDTLILIFSTKTQLKSNATVTKLVPYLNSRHGVRWPHRVQLIPLLLELSDLKSIIDAVAFLKTEVPKIDSIILNAGSFCFATFDWTLMVKELWKDIYTTMTYPCYKIQVLRAVSKQKIVKGDQVKELGEIGTVFASNVFGHYFLVHQLMGLLCKSDYYHGKPGRVMWTSSLEAYDWAFTPRDLQCLRTANPYEASKRLMDILILTAYHEKNKAALNNYLTPSNPSTSWIPTDPLPELKTTNPPTLILTHPGVCATTFVKELPFYMSIWLIPSFWLCKMIFNSVWHTVFPYNGAKATVWFTLADTEETDQFTGLKTGSSMIRFQEDCVRDTEVIRGPDWDELGSEVWRQMEDLRLEWERKIGL